jgi:hypothetical protein
MGAATERNVRMQHFVCRSSCLSFRRYLAVVRRQFMQRLFAPLHGILGSYVRDALKGALLMFWHAFLFLGLRHVRFFPPRFFLIGGFHCLFL